MERNKNCSFPFHLLSFPCPLSFLHLCSPSPTLTACVGGALHFLPGQTACVGRQESYMTSNSFLVTRQSSCDVPLCSCSVLVGTPWTCMVVAVKTGELHCILLLVYVAEIAGTVKSLWSQCLWLSVSFG